MYLSLSFSLSLYIYIYIYTHIHIYTYTSICIYTHMFLLFLCLCLKRTGQAVRYTWGFPNEPPVAAVEARRQSGSPEPLRKGSLGCFRRRCATCAAVFVGASWGQRPGGRGIRPKY